MLIRLMVICVAWAVAHVAVSQTSAPSAQPAGVGATPAAKLAHAELDGAAIMAEQVRRHQQFPYVYEEQTMVLIDETGHRRVRKARRYMRVEKDLSVKFLLVFLDPEEIRGVALLARRTSVGVMRSHVLASVRATDEVAVWRWTRRGVSCTDCRRRPDRGDRGRVLLPACQGHPQGEC